jgi:hypothetical protein
MHAAVTIAVGGGGAATVFVQSLFAWLTQRRQGATLRLDMTEADGQETHMELDGIRPPGSGTRSAARDKFGDIGGYPT